MGEVAPVTVGAASLFPESIAGLCFVGVFVDIAPQFFDAVSELALLAIGAVSFLREVFAQRALYFVFGDVLPFGRHSTWNGHEVVIPVGGGLGNSIVLGLNERLQK